MSFFRELQLEVTYVQEPPQAVKVNGIIQSSETVKLSFMLPGGTRYNYIDCYVSPTEQAPYQLLFSYKYMADNKMIVFDAGRLLPMQSLSGASASVYAGSSGCFNRANKKTDEQATQQAQEEQRRRERVALEQQRQSQTTSAANHEAPKRLQ